MWLNVFAGIMQQDNAEQVILDPKLIASHYLRTWFFLDLISSIPLDYIYLIFNKVRKSYARLPRKHFPIPFSCFSTRDPQGKSIVAFSCSTGVRKVVTSAFLPLFFNLSELMGYLVGSCLKLIRSVSSGFEMAWIITFWVNHGQWCNTYFCEGL